MNGPKRVIVFVVIVVVAAALMFMFSGCSLTKGRIKAPGVTVQGPKDGNNVSLASGKSGEVLPLPEGSRLVITKTEAVRAIPATETTPAVAPQPAQEVTEVVLSRDTEWRRDKEEVVANTGEIDTSVARHRIDVQSRQWLLYAAGILGLASIITRVYFPAWPTLPNGLMFAAIAAFGAWKLAEVPWWAWIAVLVVAGTLILGYKRREKDERAEAIAPVVVVQPIPKP